MKNTIEIDLHQTADSNLFCAVVKINNRSFNTILTRSEYTAMEAENVFIRPLGQAPDSSGCINTTHVYTEAPMAQLVAEPNPERVWKAKAEKWDALEMKISAFYVEDSVEAEEGDLGSIGEVAAIAFGYL